MTYRGILSNSWFTKPRPEPVKGRVISKPIPPPAESFEHHPLDSEPLPVGKSATREGWRERGYGDDAERNLPA